MVMGTRAVGKVGRRDTNFSLALLGGPTSGRMSGTEDRRDRKLAQDIALTTSVPPGAIRPRCSDQVVNFISIAQEREAGKGLPGEKNAPCGRFLPYREEEASLLCQYG